MKIAPLMRAYANHDEIQPFLVHTGQHYDERMNKWFFDELEIPTPDVNLGVGSGSHAVQTAQIMTRFEELMLVQKPEAVLVVGDVNSTVACALVATKLGTPVIHVEAGLRSFDRAMPEEINRVVTDTLSDLLFVTEQSGLENLRREGVPDERVHFVGNVMIDTLLRFKAKAAESLVLETLKLTRKGYTTVTLHRPSNVDDDVVFGRILDAFEEIQSDMPMIFPMHPRTRSNLSRGPLGGRIEAMRNLRIIEPLGYLDFLHLTSQAACVLTDSGGIQEETTILGVPCLTLRENTERPVTLTDGTNQLVGSDPEKILTAFRQVVGQKPLTQRPELWDGSAADRIVKIIHEWGVRSIRPESASVGV